MLYVFRFQSPSPDFNRPVVVTWWRKCEVSECGWWFLNTQIIISSTIIYWTGDKKISMKKLYRYRIWHLEIIYRHGLWFAQIKSMTHGWWKGNLFVPSTGLITTWDTFTLPTFDLMIDDDHMNDECCKIST